MAIYKMVYICDSDPNVWFEKREDAERFDKKAEVAAYVQSSLVSSGWEILDILCVVERIMERYDITQRWDWAESVSDEREKEGHDETTTT